MWLCFESIITEERLDHQHDEQKWLVEISLVENMSKALITKCETFSWNSVSGGTTTLLYWSQHWTLSILVTESHPTLTLFHKNHSQFTEINPNPHTNESIISSHFCLKGLKVMVSTQTWKHFYHVINWINMDYCECLYVPIKICTLNLLKCLYDFVKIWALEQLFQIFKMLLGI